MKKVLLLSTLLSLLIPSVAFATEPTNMITQETNVTSNIEAEVKDVGETDFQETTSIKVGYGYVTLQALPEPIIHQTLYIDFFNIHTYEEYSFDLYEKNDYKTCVELPAGTYLISSGGVPNDFKYEFPPELKQFVVEPNVSSYVSFTVGDPEKIATTDITKPPKEVDIKVSYSEGETHTVGEDDIEFSEENITTKKSKKSNIVWDMIKTFFFPTVIIIALVIYIKRKK